MTVEQFKEVEDLFFRLQPLSADERRAALATVDPVVREETEKLLGVSIQDTDPLTQFGSHVSKFLPAAADARPTTLVGEVVGPYRVLSLIGQGGMGVVYLAEDIRLGRRAALKAILPDAQQTTTRLDRFRREARVLANLSDVNIATVYGLEESHGTLLLAMEYIQGQTLAQRLQRGAKLQLHEALSICDQVAAGIQCAHDAGIIHRDLKPANVMITNEGVVKVLDFGLARDIADRGSVAPASENLTREGSIFGTPAYMSPEQARGDNLDRRSDIFSFGVLLFRCLAGRLPFDGETDAELADAILHHEPEWSRLPAGTPEPIRRLLKRAMAKNPAHRYHHIADARLEIREAQTAPAPEPAAKPRRRRIAALPWAACLLLAGGLVGMWANRTPEAVPVARRFDLTLPGNVPQTDLERLQLAVSHDGRQIVVASSTPATGQALWARNYTDGQWRLIPGSHGGHRPFLSQDGQWIGFHRSSSIYKRRFGEGEAIRLGTSTNWYGASFVEDGSVVWASAWNAALNYAPPSGGLPTDLTTLHTDKSDFAHLSPAVINGTRWVVFTSWRGNEDADIDAIHLDTRQRHPVITNATTPRVAKTPRGMYLLFERASTVFAAPLDPATAKLTAREAPIADGVLTDGTRFASYFDATDEGTLVYIPGGAFSEENRLSYVNPDGSTTPFNDDRLAFAEPKFALDGSKMCVSIKGKVYKALVYNLKRNTREMIQLGFDVTGSEVMPDGSGLLLTVNRDGGYGVDYYSLATGRIVRRIVEPGPDYPSDLSVSPDGKFMVYTCSAVAGSPRDIWIVDLAEGAKPRQMVKTPYTDQHGAVSPNGKWVAFTSEMSGRAEVHIVGVPDGQPIRQITYSGGTEPAWAPDGQSLYYIADGVLMKVSMPDDGRVTSPPTVVYDKPFGQSDNIARNMTVAPDGRPMIVEPSERRPQITNLQVITNWWTLLPK